MEALVLFIHHYQDTEREEKPPARVKRLAKRFCEKGGPALSANARAFMSGVSPHPDRILSKPNAAWGDYWEIVIEDIDL